MSDTGFSKQNERDEPIFSKTDRAVFLARLLEKRGISLGLPWRDALTSLTVRAYNVLAASGYITLTEVLQALRHDGQELMRKKNFGRKSLNDLWNAIEQLAGPGAPYYQSSFFGTPESSASIFPDEAAESWAIRQSLSEYTLFRLEAAGVNPDQPWQNVLPAVSTRLRKVLEEHFVTLREVVIAATDGLDSFRKTRNIGQTSLRELWESLEKLAEHGAGYVRYGNQGAPPATIDELVGRAFESLSDQEGRLLTRRILDEATLEQLGREYGLTRERIRQKVVQILLKLRRRMSASALALTEPLVEAVDHSGGLLHRDTVLSLMAADDLRRVRLALLIAGDESFHVWRGAFFTTLKSDELSARLDAIRRCFRENRKRDLALSEVSDLIAEAAGFRLDAAGLTALLTHYFGCRITEGRMVIPRALRVSDRLEKILRTAGRPMHISEITDLHLASLATPGGEERADPDEGEDEEAPLQLSEAERRKRAEHALLEAIDRDENIYQCGPKTFIHINALPIPFERLNEVVEFCIAYIEGEPGTVAADFLLKILEENGLDHHGLNKYLLKDALSRRPEIVSLRKFRVGHTASFQEHGLKLTDRIETILRTTDRPLSSIEIHQRLPHNIQYSPNSTTVNLRDAPFAVNLGQKYIHIQSLGLTDDQCRRLVEMIVDLLPRDGAPVSCTAISENLRPQLTEFGLADREDVADVLRGLLRLKADVLWGSGSLVARRVEG